MRNTGLEEAQAGIKNAGRNINNLRYAYDTTLMAESENKLKSLLMNGEQSRVLSPNGRGGWTPLRPLRGLQETRVATPWTAGHQASLSIINSRSLLKLMSHSN